MVEEAVVRFAPSSVSLKLGSHPRELCLDARFVIVNSFLELPQPGFDLSDKPAISPLNPEVAYKADGQDDHQPQVDERPPNACREQSRLVRSHLADLAASDTTGLFPLDVMRLHQQMGRLKAIDFTEIYC